MSHHTPESSPSFVSGALAGHSHSCAVYCGCEQLDCLAHMLSWRVRCVLFFAPAVLVDLRHACVSARSYSSGREHPVCTKAAPRATSRPPCSVVAMKRFAYGASEDSIRDSSPVHQCHATMFGVCSCITSEQIARATSISELASRPQCSVIAMARFATWRV